MNLKIEARYQELTFNFPPPSDRILKSFLLSFLFSNFRLWWTKMDKTLFFSSFCYFITQHFMTQNNLYYLCHTYAIMSIKKMPIMLIMPIMAGHYVLRWEIWHANPPISYYKLFGHYKLAYSICKNFHMSHISKFHSQLAKSKHEIFTHALSHEINIEYNI